MIRLRTLLPAGLLASVAFLTGSVEAQTFDARGFYERWKKESAIERKLIVAEVRGELGLVKRPLPPDWTPRKWGKGELEVKDGVPVLRVEGTPAEMGEQQGHLVGREARALSDSYLPAFLGGRNELERGRVRARELFWPHLSDDEKAEIGAFAKASGIDERDVLLAQGFADLYRAWGCSTLAAVGDAAPYPGQPLLARNLDFVTMGFLQDYSYVVVARPANKTPFVSLGFPGVLGVISGENARGVALAVMVVHDEHGCVAGVPFTFAFRRALETADTTEDAIATLERLPRTVANNLMVVDRHETARLLEITPAGIVARSPDARGLLSSTNHFQSKELREPRMTLTYLSSKQRLGAVEKTCRDESRITVPVAIAALRAAAPARINVQGMIFEPATRSIHVAFGKPPAVTRPFVKLDGAWLFRAP
jgi:hypothetical protein